MASSSWHQLALHTGCASAAIFAARAAAVRAVPAAISDRPRTLWYLEHALVNMLLAAMAVPAVCATWRAPRESLDPDLHAWDTAAGTPFPLVLATTLHVYHALFYSVSRADAVHHVCFALPLALPGALFRWGALGNAQLFFICGLPGGLAYLMSALQRCGVANGINEPLWTAVLSAGLRAPGTLACALCMAHVVFVDATAPQPDAPWTAVLAQLLLSPINAVWYAGQACARARRRLARKDA